jgi:succinate dehydrogenase/fumarate reductase flavoprotein subunit
LLKAYRLEKGLKFFERAQEELEQLGATDPHELMRASEAGFIRDCAEMAARASLFRTESRWGLYHHRLDFPEMDDANWFVHVNLKKGADGTMKPLQAACGALCRFSGCRGTALLSPTAH